MQKVSDFQSQSFANKTVLVTWRQPPFGEAPTNFDISMKPAKSSNVKTVRVSAKAPSNDRPFDGWRYAHTVDVSDISGSFELWIVGTNKAERVSSNTQSLIVGEGKARLAGKLPYRVLCVNVNIFAQKSSQPM